MPTDIRVITVSRPPKPTVENPPRPFGNFLWCQNKLSVSAFMLNICTYNCTRYSLQWDNTRCTVTQPDCPLPVPPCTSRMASTHSIPHCCTSLYLRSSMSVQRTTCNGTKQKLTVPRSVHRHDGRAKAEEAWESRDAESESIGGQHHHRRWRAVQSHEGSRRAERSGHDAGIPRFILG